MGQHHPAAVTMPQLSHEQDVLCILPIVDHRVTPELSLDVGPPAGEKPALDVLKGGTYHREFAEDPDKSEYFMRVKWLDTVPLEKGIKEIGLFGQQNTVARPTSQKWRHTVDRLKQLFPKWDQ